MKKKKLISMLLIGAMLARLGLSGCGSENKSQIDDNIETQTIGNRAYNMFFEGISPKEYDNKNVKEETLHKDKKSNYIDIEL